MWMVSPQSPLAKQDAVSSRNRATTAYPSQNWVHAQADGQIASPVRFATADSDGIAQRWNDQELRRRGLGVTLISASFARDQVVAGRVKLLGFDDRDLWRELGIAYRRDRTLSRAATNFINSVRQLARAASK